MEFDYFLSLVSKLRASDAAGFRSHVKMIPKERIIPGPEEITKAQPRRAAVMALFYPDKSNRTNFLLILRADYDGTHSAQIGLPGGKYEKSDISLKITALRETFEEVGVATEDVLIKTTLTDTFIPPSNFMVRPYIGIIPYTPVFKVNHEVKDIIEVALDDLLDESSVSMKNLSTSYLKNIDVPCFKLNNRTVWGATAMMLSEIKDLIKHNLH